MKTHPVLILEMYGLPEVPMRTHRQVNLILHKLWYPLVRLAATQTPRPSQYIIISYVFVQLECMGFQVIGQGSWNDD